MRGKHGISALLAAGILALAAQATAQQEMPMQGPMEQPPPAEQPPLQQPMQQPMVEPMPVPVQPMPTTAPGQPTDQPYGTPVHYVPHSIYGVALTAGGGATDFEYAGASSVTNTGGSWDIRLAFGTRTFLGVEAAYVGAAQTISGLGLGSSNTLLRNGAEGVLRGQFPMPVGLALFEPYAFLGLGWNHYSLSNTPVVTANIGSSDDVLTVPWGFGFSAGYKGFLADARFTYRPTYDASILGNNVSMTNWNIGGAIGYEF